jgi:hypothetical protein
MNTRPRPSRSPRWFYYILLNIIISALVTMTVLFFYDHYQRSLEVQVPVIVPTPAVLIGGEVNADLKMEIVSVIGAGAAETEIAVIQNKGENSVLLAGWILRSGDGTAYTFPQVKMFKDGILQVHTASGASTPLDLYWGRTDPVWRSGDTASLFDTQGNLRATYLIP